MSDPIGRRIGIVVCAVCCLGGVVCVSWAAAADETLKTADVNASEEPAYVYVIGPQNLIQIKVIGDSSVNQIYRVDERGNINHALVGSVKLSGLTVSEAERLMQSKLSGDYVLNPRVNIFVLEHSRFSIIGEVQRPGTYEITGRVSVIEAVSMAGGFSRIANQRDVKIMRKNDGAQSTIPVDTTRITKGGMRDEEIYIAADDVIVVGKSFF